jgi:hypothetical protein
MTVSYVYTNEKGELVEVFGRVAELLKNQSDRLQASDERLREWSRRDERWQAVARAVARLYDDIVDMEKRQDGFSLELKKLYQKEKEVLSALRTGDLPAIEKALGIGE